MDRTALITDEGQEVTPGPSVRPPHLPLPPTRHLVAEALRHVPATPEPPSWSQRLLPKTLRTALADLGLYANPTPQPPSVHLMQTYAVIQHYGHCKSVDFSPTGRVCIRGAQSLLEKTGHVTPQARDQAVSYMQQTLNQAGVRMQFFAWNDLPDTPESAIHTLLTTAAYRARANGD